jgi:2-haloacid dehalogenase
MTNHLRGIRACVFDAYGTLFDFGSAAAACADVLGDRTAALTALWRDKQLQYSWLRGLQGRYAPFRQVTGEALDFALESLGLAGDPALRARLMDLYDRLDPFPEVPAVLGALRARGLATATLSNGSPDMLGAACASSGLDGLLDAVISVEEVPSFKPDPRVYRLAPDRLGVAAAEILFVSANGWDAWAASAFGMRVAWCNRAGARPERLPGAPDAEVRSLADLPALLG